MRHKTVSIALSLLAGVLLTAAVLRSQMPAVGPQWEYATITGWPGKTMLCYGAASGCKNEQVGAENDALMAAAMKLGEKGWEMAAAVAPEGPRQERILYFKRLKSAINKNEDRR